VQATSNSTNRPLELARVSEQLLWLTFATLIILKLVFAIITEVGADEAYYWTWSQIPALSYYDHPPLNAWLIGLTSFVFGANKLGLRFGAFLSFAGTLYVMWLFAQRLVPQASTKAFLLSAVVFLASPTLFVWTTIVYNDHLLIFVSLAATYCFTVYFSSFSKDQTTSPKMLFAAAAFLGAAGLTKYNAAFMGLGVALLIVSHPKLRPMMTRPYIYLAGLLTITAMAPVLIWNMQNDFASFQLHLATRYGDTLMDRFHAATFARYIYSTIIYFGPFLVIPMVALFLPIKPNDNFAEFGIWLTRIVIVVSLLTFTLFSARGTVHWYWSDVSYALMILFIPLILRWVWVYFAHVLTSLVLIGYGLFSYTLLPIDYFLGATNVEVGRMHAWDEVAARINTLSEIYEPDYLATSGYPTTGQLSYSLGRTDIYELINPISHYDFVDRKKLPEGSNAIILHDHFGHIDQIEPKFETLTKIDSLVIERLGVKFFTYEFYLGEGFKSPD